MHRNFDDSSVDKLIDDWIRLQYSYRAGQPANDAFWAFEALDAMCAHDPRACLDTVRRIFERDSSGFILANLAAGPVEDLLVRHGTSIIGAIEQLALVEPRMTTIVSGVWRNTIDEVVWGRIEKLRAGGEGVVRQ